MLVLIVCFAAFLAWLSIYYQLQMDWTRSERHTLSVASQQVLSKMGNTVEVVAYVRTEHDSRQKIRQFIGYYQQFKPDLTVRFVNPDSVPDEVRKLGISANGELLLRYHDRIQHVKQITEEQFTNALERLLRAGDQWITFVDGHGERDPLGEANHDLSLWGEQLTARGFSIQPLNLATVDAIPANTKVLVLASPAIALVDREVSVIMNYLSQGGNILWLTEPGKLHGLGKLADTFGIHIAVGTVIDVAARSLGMTDDPTIVLSPPSLYPEHVVTDGFNYTTFFPRAAAIEATHDTEWHKSPLLISSVDTWLEVGVVDAEVSHDVDSDRPGPFSIGLALHREHAYKGVDLQQRSVVIGDGDFLSNAYIANGGNLDLGLRLLNWLSEQGDFIDIPARVVDDSRLELSLFASLIIGFGFVFILPALFLSVGVFIWWYRERR